MTGKTRRGHSDTSLKVPPRHAQFASIFIKHSLDMPTIRFQLQAFSRRKQHLLIYKLLSMKVFLVCKYNSFVGAILGRNVDGRFKKAGVIHWSEMTPKP